MNYLIKLTAVVIICNLPLLCYSNNSNDFFDNLPENTIISIGESYSDYSQIILELPDGKSDTIWVEAKNKNFTDNLSDGRRILTNSNRFTPPQITEYESSTQKVKKITLSEAKYPKDALSKEISGLVKVECIVEKDGSLSNIVIKESVWPSIDNEAIRLLSKQKLIPFKIGDKPFRCRHKIALAFNLKTEKKKKEGEVCYSIAKNPPKGVDKRFNKISSKSIEHQGKWTALIDLDIPEDNKDLEELLCKTLFGVEGKSLIESGNEFTKNFRGEFNYQEYKIEGRYLAIVAHVNGYKKDKYYSYFYDIVSSTREMDNHYNEFGTSLLHYTHNIIYGIQEKRFFGATDLIKQSYLDELCNNWGIPDPSVLEIGMDDYFFYLGINDEGEASIAIGLSQENWDKFTPTMQKFIGNKSDLPLSLNPNDFEYDQEPDYIREVIQFEDGSRTITTIQKGLKQKKEGIQPAGIKKGIIRKPNIGSDESLYHEYLAEIWEKSDVQPDNEGFVANISFSLNKDQTVSDFHTEYKKGDVNFYQKFINLFNKTPKWKTMLFAIDGPVKNYFNFDVECAGIVYEYAEKMPEYPGGFRALFQWISNEITIPDDVPAEALNNRIFVNCIIEEDGSVSNAKVSTPIDDSLRKEIERVIGNMPKWNPGKKEGKVTRVKTAFPLRINLVR